VSGHGRQALSAPDVQRVHDAGLWLLEHVGFEVLDPGNRVIARSDLQEGDDVGEIQKSKSLLDLEPGRYLVHLYLQGRMDSADYLLRVPATRTYQLTVECTAGDAGKVIQVWRKNQQAAQGTVAGSGATPVFTRPQMPWEHAMHRQARRFIHAVRGDAPVPCGAEEALRDLQIARDYFHLLKGI
jgi:hypothetical protein